MPLILTFSTVKPIFLTLSLFDIKYEAVRTAVIVRRKQMTMYLD